MSTPPVGYCDTVSDIPHYAHGFPHAVPTECQGWREMTKAEARFLIRESITPAAYAELFQESPYATSGLEDFHRAVREGRVRDTNVSTHVEGNTLHVKLAYLVDAPDNHITINITKFKEPEVPKVAGENDYTLVAICGNCGHRGAITYQKGEPATDGVCPNCGNRTFHPQRKAWS